MSQQSQAGIDAERPFRLAFAALLASVLALRVLSAIRVHQAGERLLPDRAAIEREGRAVFVARVVLFVALLGILALYVVDAAPLRRARVPLSKWPRWTGFGFGLLSLALWAWAQQTLGRFWSPQLQLRDQHVLVTTGPYRWVRHPLYSALAGFSIAVGLVTANGIFIGLAVVAVAGLLFVRIPQEEAMLAESFGTKYDEYARRTGSLLPQIGSGSRPH